MKKLSLVLALILVLTCGVLAACNGDETTSEAVSSEAASEASSKAESSAESAVESTVESNVESTVESTPEDASSEAVSEEESTPAASEPEISGDNLAKGKSYTVSGCGTGSAQYTANLTDGVAATAMSYDNNWFAFYYNDGADSALINAPDKVGYVIIDLGEATDISAVRLNLVNDSGAGVPAPKKVTVSLSTDGESFGDAVSMPINANADKAAYWSEGAIEGNAQYVKIEFTLDGVFAFINEVEIY